MKPKNRDMAAERSNRIDSLIKDRGINRADVARALKFQIECDYTLDKPILLGHDLYRQIMKTRFFQIVWVLSMCWLGLVAQGAFKKHIDWFNSLGFVLIFGSPSIIGLFATYIFTGSFWIPENK